MRYLRSALLLAVAGSAFVFACGDGDSPSISASLAGNGGQAGETGGAGGTTAKGGGGGKSGAAGSAGKGGGAGTAGTGGAATAGSGGQAGGGTGGIGVAGATAEGGVGGETGGAGAAGEAGTGGIVQQLGSLQITISGLPAGSVASATITGPGGFSKAISSTTTVSDLSLGSYAVTALPVRVAGTQVDSVFDATVTGTATVVAGATANVSVTYTQRVGTGVMWVTNSLSSSRTALGFSAAQLAITGTITNAASGVITLPKLGAGTANSITALAFSASGDAWFSYCTGGSSVPQAVAKFGPAKLASGSPEADVVITLPTLDGSYDCADGLAFDSSGNLWVGFYRNNIIKLNASSLTTSGTPTPAVTLTSPSFKGLTDLAFDGSGNLFVAAFSTTTIARLSPTQLAADNATLAPDVLLTLPASAGIGGLALDKGGNLWAADYNHNSVIEYNAADLGVTGTPTPKETFTGVAGPEQLAFDGAGNLWVASYNGNRVLGFAAADIATGGAKTPITTFTSNSALSAPFAVRFNPGTP